MDYNYESCYGGYQYNYEYHYSEVWCEICGEPHYTQDCYHYQGYPTDFHQPYWKPYEETTPPQEIQYSALESDSWTPGNLFRHLEEIKVQILKSYPTEQQDDPFKIQESKVIAPTSLVGPSDSKEQEPSSFTSMDQSEVRPDDSEERVTTTFQSRLDFSERLEAKPSKELEERISKEELVGIFNMEAQQGCMEKFGVSITSETTSYEQPDCETNIQDKIMQEEVFTNKQMTRVGPLPYNSDSWPVTKHISESFHESHMPQDRAHHSEDHFSWRKQRSSNENYVTKLSYRGDRLLHYMGFLKFGPGNFKWRWRDLITLFSLDALL
ncbi:hypothetical protein L1987_24105 [Smallanthus sonchifolius]|uniref:Uncharacterized protein n=1 Tax=Smallanthus sonchifolius TaxID=185202 RepID=A0ACB9IJR0_9ASTR|nr:hypothetical protein L1987_24105 [Smallanthus sonchifolius]